MIFFYNKGNSYIKGCSQRILCISEFTVLLWPFLILNQINDIWEIIFIARNREIITKKYLREEISKPFKAIVHFKPPCERFYYAAIFFYIIFLQMH